MSTYRVKVRYENKLGVNAVVGEVETGPGASILGPQFLALHLDQDTRDTLTEMARETVVHPSAILDHGPVLNIAIHRIYSIEQLDDVARPEVKKWGEGLQPTRLASPRGNLDDYQWSAGAPRPVGVPEVWDRNGDRWDLEEGNGLWHSEGQQFPEPWEALLEHYGPVTNRFRA